ncbi:TetR family transcriptional regulator [Streptomyces sp. NA04227]|uniref:TetR/AcrR family transcriptional regulator n=1 Tax=Streptomyces sp. NA04227 TaxID=2742136 RepID=UPI0015911EEA|nr:TetR/AcrR family transcriptional regulator [Streptomyces sp. NA04227]QKW07595.1 TetR family transcriptional regulator [Streptomyces sp. NA04227]
MARMPSAERRVQLVEAAIRAMTRDGVAKTTTRSICAEAGVSLSVFHYCFDSKQALLEAVIETITGHSLSTAMAAIQPRATVRETVRAVLQAYWDHVLAHPGEHMLTYELTQYALREPGFEHLARPQYERYTAAGMALVGQLREAFGLELLVPAETLSRYLAVMADGLTLHYLVLGDEAGAAGVLDTVADQIVALTRTP